MNLVNELQEALGYPELKKIDPNTQDTKEESYGASELLPQAAVPAVLTGLYKYTRNAADAAQLLNTNFSTGLETQIFGSDASEVTAKVAGYAHVSNDNAQASIEKIFLKAVQLIKEHAGANADGESVKTFLTSQRPNILLYLPPDLKMGELLNDPTLDDRTNKMEGPVSSFMHTIEKIFSGTEEQNSADTKPAS